MSTPVSILKEHHDRKKPSCSPPSYIDSKDGNIFVITCLYQKLKTQGRGPKKKAAKEESASKMLEIIRPNVDIVSSKVSPQNCKPCSSSWKLSVGPISTENILNNTLMNPSYAITTADIIKTFIDKCSDQINTSINDLKTSSKAIDLHAQLKTLKTAPSISILSDQENHVNPVLRFIKLMETLDIRYWYNEVGVTKDKMIAVILKLSHESLVFGALGNSEREAIEKVSLQVLNMFRIFME